jgi:hypothetical protein
MVHSRTSVYITTVISEGTLIICEQRMATYVAARALYETVNRSLDLTIETGA